MIPESDKEKENTVTQKSDDSEQHYALGNIGLKKFEMKSLLGRDHNLFLLNVGHDDIRSSYYKIYNTNTQYIIVILQNQVCKLIDKIFSFRICWIF